MTQVCIAGFAALDRRPRPERLCRSALDGIGLFGGRPLERHVGRASFGALSFSAQSPLAAIGERYLCVADESIENVADLRRALGSSPKGSGAALLLAAWLRWGEALTDHLVGEYAFAIYDHEDQSLVLARDPSGYRPLFYARLPGVLGFASMPSGLTSSVVDQQPDLPHVAAYLGGSAGGAFSTFWKGVNRVPPGSVLRISANRITRRDILSPPEAELAAEDWPGLVEKLRAGIDRAVGRCLDGADGTVGIHLSSGLDSSAVLSSAARQVPKETRPLALTAAPVPDARLLVPRGRFSDESVIAAQTAQMNGVEHLVLRNRARLLPAIRGLGRYFQQPAPAQFSFPWWRESCEAIRERGGSMLLTGGQGNATISFGGLHVLSSVLARRGVGPWLREMRALRRTEPVRWRGMLFNSVRPLLPAWLDSGLLRLSSGRPMVPVTYLRPEWVGRPAQRSRRSYFAGRVAMITGFDSGVRKRGMLALTGIDERDPLADRELIDLSLSLPPEAFLSGGRMKPLIREVLADRVPATVLENRSRGISGADWYERIDAADCREALEEIRASRSASEILDLAALQRAIDAWPEFGGSFDGGLNDFGLRIGRALSTGLFLAETDRYPLGGANPRR